MQCEEQQQEQPSLSSTKRTRNHLEEGRIDDDVDDDRARNLGCHRLAVPLKSRRCSSPSSPILPGTPLRCTNGWSVTEISPSRNLTSPRNVYHGASLFPKRDLSTLRGSLRMFSPDQSSHTVTPSHTPKMADAQADFFDGMDEHQALIELLFGKS